ncbi:MMPL family transporter [Jongsikchunia kroppenstedtii]|uniref:MMPL family transporter n=1 Tax=Jongsikchunia kroppenstedtii TaxID=1121721 RepID=UPI0003789195|nr:MMPL family transporter [Jongsikchunia kroppenstedtii]
MSTHPNEAATLPSMWFRLGRNVARWRWPVLTTWLLVLIACAVAYPQLSKQLQGPDYSVTGSESAAVERLVRTHFNELGTEQDALVFATTAGTVDDPAMRTVVAETLDAVRADPGVAAAIGPFDMLAQGQISADRRSAVAIVGLSGTARTNMAVAKRIQGIVTGHARDGVTVSMTGFSPTSNDLGRIENSDAERSESIGLPVALVVLIVALGSVIAGVLPLIAAGAGLLCAFGAITALSTGLTFDSMLVVVATMIGTGIGIDYSLFIIARIREEMDRRAVVDRRQHAEIADAVGVGIATAGRTIAISGLILMIAMCSLMFVDSPVFHEITIGIIATVLCVLLVALTLVPAIIAVLGPWLTRLSVRGLLPKRRRGAADANTDRPWRRWAYLVMRQPIVFGAAVIALLLIALLPVTGLRYGIDYGLRSLADTPSGRANTVLQQDFSPGLMSPIQIVATGSRDGSIGPNGQRMLQQFEARLHADPRIVGVAPEAIAGRQLWLAIPRDPVDSNAALTLVRDLRQEARALSGPDIRVQVGGATAMSVDVSDETTSALPWVLVAVLALSLVFLAAVFRSVVLPLKAVLMNLLSTGAALGITIAIFQWGWGQGLLGFTSVGYLQVYLPITVFVVLFGLSMDYEVFLLGRMKESWDERTAQAGDADPVAADARNMEAVADGIEHTAGPITAAAVIMIVVFASFVSADVLELKEFGVALSVAVAIDAVLVRMVLVPAFMKLLGRWNWWPGNRFRLREQSPPAGSTSARPTRHTNFR